MKKIIYSLASLALCAPLFASAAEGVLVADISLQAGPDTEYPSIEELNAGTPVSIQGCLDAWSWCDVIAGNGDRGWIPGTFIEETYDNQRVVVTDYGARIGIPIVSFSIGTYWGSHYHDRPFFAQRQQWESRSIHVRTPPRPSGVATVARPTGTQTQTQDRRTTTTAPQRQAAPAPSATPAPAATERATTTQRADTERSANERTAKAAHPESRPMPEPLSKPESAPMATKPTDMPERMKPEQHAPQVAQGPKPAAAKQNEEAKAREPKSKDELKPEKKKEKDDGGGGN